MATCGGAFILRAKMERDGQALSGHCGAQAEQMRGSRKNPASLVQGMLGKTRLPPPPGEGGRAGRTAACKAGTPVGQASPCAKTHGPLASSSPIPFRRSQAGWSTARPSGSAARERLTPVSQKEGRKERDGRGAGWSGAALEKRSREAPVLRACQGVERTLRRTEGATAASKAGRSGGRVLNGAWPGASRDQRVPSPPP